MSSEPILLRDVGRAARGASRGSTGPLDLDDLMVKVARGDERAFATLFDAVASAVFGVAQRVVRDPSRAEEVAQEVLLQVWRTASRFDSGRGSAMSYILTITHRRAVDVVRHEQSAKDREQRNAVAPETPYDAVDEAVSTRFEREQVRRCLATLTELQKEAVTLAYYGGYTYPEVASLLQANPATVKTRLRDGLIRLRDCLGVAG
jgi:RNA polymerase sigma-70 factor, ECF subfamily